MKRSTKKKVAFVLPSAQPGGAERVFLTLLERLDRQRFELHLILIAPEGFYLKYIPADVRLHPLGFSRVAQALPSLVRILRDLKPDAVLSTIGHLNLSILLVKPLLNKKTRVYVRESSIPSKAFGDGRKNALLRFLYPLLYPLATSIICPGDAVRKDLIRHFSIKAQKTVVIPNPVEVEAIRSKGMQAAKADFGDRTEIVAAGALGRQKGFDLLIDAMPLLVQQSTKLHLTILGEGPERENLERQIELLGLGAYITLAGFQENPYAYYHSANLFVLSSRREGLPNVILESLACGTPVVAFDCPGCVREILDDPSLGVLVPAEDVEGLASAIVERLGNIQNNDKRCLLPARFHAANVTRYYESILSA